MFWKKYGAKLFFGLSCVLLIAALTFSAVSFARFVSHVSSGGGAGTATIDCRVNVSKEGTENTFVNAPYLQSVTGNVVSVRMNNWAETKFSVENHGKFGLKYEYSFVFYVPTVFAERAMFQLLELGSDAKTVVKASDMYSVADSGTELVVTTQTKTGLKFENEYATLMSNAGGKLEVDSTKVTDGGTRAAKLKTTFVTTYPASMGGGLGGKLVCPVSFMRDKKVVKTDTGTKKEDLTLDYKMITVNLTRSSTNRYMLENGDEHSFKLRTVLLEAREDIGTNENKDFSLETYGDLEAINTPGSGYFVKWAGEGAGKHLVAAEIEPLATGETADEVVEVGGESYKVTGEYLEVTPGTCMGLGAPCRIAAVFTQVE